MGESQRRYITRLNVENYRRRLLTERDDARRQILVKLLTEELQKQSDAGDPAVLVKAA